MNVNDMKTRLTDFFKMSKECGVELNGGGIKYRNIM
jgi:hypothetical protein